MKNINFELDITKSGVAYIRTYQPVMLNKETGKAEEMMIYSSEEAAMHEAEIFEKIGYKFMYLNKNIVFLE